MIADWYFGFHRPALRNSLGKIDPRGWFGHCEAWGLDGETWIFIDPQGRGMGAYTAYRESDVLAALQFRTAHCDMILRYSGRRKFRFPVHGMMTCAAICGSLVGLRALLPSTLKRRLLASDAEIVHEVAQVRRRSRGKGRARA